MRISNDMTGRKKMKRIFPKTDLYGITDDGLSCGRGNIETVRGMLDAGVRIVQYREKNRKMGIMLEECRVIRRMTLAANACFIVNDHVDIALLVDADGVHVGQEDLPPEAVRELIGPDRILGLSTHSPEQAIKAVAEGVDYLGVGPIFATKTKKDVCEPVGFSYLAYVADHLDIPFVAIGGIKAENIRDVVRYGAKCCALVSAIVGAEDIGLAVSKIRKNMVSP